MSPQSQKTQRPLNAALENHTIQNKGFILITTLIFVSISLVQIGFLTKSFLSFKNNLHKDYIQSKMFLLSQSGINVAPDIIDLIPSITFPPTPDALFTHIHSGFSLPQLQGKVSLFKTSSRVFSVVIINNRYKQILFKDYTNTNNQKIFKTYFSEL